MALYYGIVAISVAMFGAQFLCNHEYTRLAGHSMLASMRSICVSGVCGLIALIAINGFTFGCTPFMLMMALISSVNLVACTVCGLKALGKTNLSLYSLFSMLGGMALPFVAGLYYDETMTWGKLLCLLITVAALAITVRRGQKGGMWYCVGVFVTNGLNGVFSKIFKEVTKQELLHQYASEKEDAFQEAVQRADAEFSVWLTIVTLAIAVIILLCLKDKNKKFRVSALGLSALGGTLNKIANFFLLISLTKLPATVQYPMITGGVMIVSTLLGYFTAKKPGWRELAALALSMIGIMLLVFLPTEI